MKVKGLFALFIIAQLAVPSWMIASQEQILTHGLEYKFKTAPVDPYDVFRGRYVTLGIDQRTVSMIDNAQVKRGQTIFLLLEKDAEGFTQVTGAQVRRPDTQNYIQAKVGYVYRKDQVNFRWPLDRYYLNEDKAPEAERLYRRSNRRGNQDTYIMVRVLNGKALIEDLYISGKPVYEHF